MKQAHKHSIIALSIAAALALPSVAIAEGEPTDSPIESITILADTYRNTATKTALSAEETPQAINIIDAEQLKNRAVHSIGEILQYTPGITTDYYGADANFQDLFTIRGFNVSKTYYNGSALQALSGWNLQPQIDPIAIEQVEIFKGPTSVLYGATPPGGMVNIITKAPQKESSTTIGAALGTNNLQELSIDSAGQIGNSDVNYRFVGLASQSDTLTSVSENERYVFAPSIDWNISDKTLLNVNLYYQNDPELGNYTSIPESVLLDNDTDISLGDDNWIGYERESLIAGYKFQHEFNEQWTFLQSFSYTTGDFYQQNTYLAYDYSIFDYAFDEVTGDYTRSIYSTEEESKSFSFDNQLSATLITGNVEHNLLMGADLQKLDGTALYSEYGSSTINVYDIDNNLIDVSSLTETVYADDDIHSLQKGLYLQDQIEFDKLIVIAGLRYDQYSADGTSFGTAYDVDSNNLSYRIGGLYTFDNGLAPFASYSTSYEPLNTSGYEPELGRQIELGLKYQSENKAISGSAALFNIVKSNVVVTDPASIVGEFTSIQLGEVTSQGLELESKLQVTDSLDITASYTYLDVEITEDTTYKGNTPLLTTDHTANLWANYSFYNGFLNGSRVGTGIRYVGEMYKDAANTQGKVPDYTVVDLSLDYDLSYASSTLDGATVNLLLTNLFDTESYVCYYNDNSCGYNAGFAAEMNINYTF